MAVRRLTPQDARLLRSIRLAALTDAVWAARLEPTANPHFVDEADDGALLGLVAGVRADGDPTVVELVGASPIEASSGPKTRHRLNPRGNRQLNHALHIIAIAQIRHPGPGRDYYQRKLDEGKSKKEALRALKRRIADAVYRALLADAQRR